MAKTSLTFIDEALAEKIRNAVSHFVESESPADHLLARLKELLPVHRTDRETWKARVEGFDVASETLIEQVITAGREKEGKGFTRDSVVSRARLRPLSYYHYVTGSREPASNVMTGEDYFNDPTTALVKLEDDLLSLGRLLRNM